MLRIKIFLPNTVTHVVLGTRNCKEQTNVKKPFGTLLSTILVFIWALPSWAQAPLEIGILPHLSTQVLLAQYQVLRDYLAQQLERPVQLLTAPDFPKFFQRTQAGDYDAVITAPHFAGLAEQEAGYRALFVFYPDIEGLLISARQGGIESADQLRGAALVIPNPKSLIAQQGIKWLAEQGLQIGRDVRVLAAANQDSTGDMILHGDGAAAILSNGEFNSIPAAVREQLRIVQVYTKIPGFVVMANDQHLAADTLERFTQAVETFPQQSVYSAAFFAGVNFKGLRRLTDQDRDTLYSYIEMTRNILSLP